MPAVPRAASVSASPDTRVSSARDRLACGPVSRLMNEPALPAGLVERLIRSRPFGTTRNFSIHTRSIPRIADRSVRGVLFLSVPKRLLKRAVDRNLVRRVARECWRGAGLLAEPQAVLVKMRARPETFAQPGIRRRRQDLRDELARLFSTFERSIAVAGHLSGNLRGGPNGRKPDR